MTAGTSRGAKLVMKLAMLTLSFALASVSAVDYDCSVCSNLTTAEEEALASYDNGGKIIVCDPTCLDGVTDPIHCNCECHVFPVFCSAADRTVC